MMSDERQGTSSAGPAGVPEQSGQGVRMVPSRVRDPRIGSVLAGKIRASREAIEAAQYEQQFLVQRAREDYGATWAEIAELLGVSPQAVQKRYGR